MIPMMVDQGYDDDFRRRLRSLPPVRDCWFHQDHNMVIYAMSAGGVSVGKPFPCRICAGRTACDLLNDRILYYLEKETLSEGDKFSVKRLLKQLGTSFWALAAVVIVVVGVVAGWFTATESAAIAVFYSLIVSVYIYKGSYLEGVSGRAWSSALIHCLSS